MVGTIFKSWASCEVSLRTPIEPDRSILRIEMFMKQVARMLEAFSACCAFFLMCGAPAIYAQSCDVKISISALAPSLAAIEGTQRAASTNWSFRNSYAGVIGMGERISSLSLSDANGKN